jgi:hypothetical protein
MPKEFIVYIVKHALEYIDNETKLNQRHVKWIEFLHKFYFVINHNNKKSAKVENALRRVNFILHEFQLNVSGFDELKEMYQDDVDFKDAYASSQNLIIRERNLWLDYMMCMKDYYLKGVNCALQDVQ